MGLTRDHFRLVFDLMKKFPWLLEKEEAVVRLLYQECESEEERSLILELIDRITHLSRVDYSNYIERLAEKIISDLGLSDENSQIVAMACNSQPDSSQLIIYDLKIALSKKGWFNQKMVNNFQKALRTYKSSPQHKNIVLVDEFVGSGQTLLGRVKTIKTQFKCSKIDDYSITAVVLVSTEQGEKIVRDNGIDLFTFVSLKKGISDFYSGEDLQLKLDLMRKLEGILAENYKGIELPALGYGELEALYSREDGNTPNNVFPIFWWPFLRDNSLRDTLLHRAL